MIELDREEICVLIEFHQEMAGIAIRARKIDQYDRRHERIKELQRLVGCRV